MEKTVREIIREVLLELNKIAVEAFDAGVNCQIETRETNGEGPWIICSLSLEGWTNLANQDEGRASFSLYNFDVVKEGYVESRLAEIRSRVEELSKLEVRQVYVVEPKK